MGAPPHSPGSERSAGSPSLRLTDTLACSPETGSTAATATAAPDVPPELALPAAMVDLQAKPRAQVARPAVPEGPPRRAETQAQPQPLLAFTSDINADEEYSRDEKMLNDFTKQHPMLRSATRPNPHTHQQD